MAGLTASLRFGTPSPKPPEASRSPSGGATGSPAGAGGKGRAQPQQMSEAAWQAECERVASKLVITAPAEAGGAWRPQLDRALASLASLRAAAPAAMAAVEGAGQELASSTEALAAAEKAADAELADLRAEHQAAVAAVAVLQQEQTARQEYVASLEQELQFLNKELEERQREMAQHGDSMSDNRPVARLAQACAALREELRAMDVPQACCSTCCCRPWPGAAAEQAPG